MSTAGNTHEHTYSGQVLRHAHDGGSEPHGYFQHPEDPPGNADPGELYNGQPLPEWRADVTTSDDGGRTWCSNALTFPDKAAALDYARDLADRWMLVTRWRAVPVTTPERQPYQAGSEDGSWS